MKKLLGLFLAVVVSGGVFAQEKTSKIDFKKVDLDTAMKMASESGKKIFCDFNTTWCKPCKVLFDEVFTDEVVGQFINDQFISLYINAEAPEWVATAKKYKIEAYPTMLILDANGEEKYRMRGALSKDDFMEQIEQFLDEKRSPDALGRRYESGERTPSLVHDHVMNIMRSGNEKLGFEIIDHYFKSLTEEQKTDKENWFLYNTFSNGDDIRATYFMNNHKKFYASNGEKVINDRMLLFVRFALMPYVSGYNISQNKFVQKEFDEALSLINLVDFEGKQELISLGEIAKARVATDLNPKDKCNDFIKVLKNESVNLNKNSYSLVLLNLSFMTLKASDKAKTTALELIADYKSKYESEKTNSGFIDKVAKSLEIIKRGDSILFEKEDVIFKKALNKAKKENKLLFIDCYTTWCGPCKKMAEEVFTVTVVKQYFDKNFINLKIDMEKGEGVELAKQFKIKGFPTFLLVNGDGEIVFTSVGSMDAEEFLALFKEKNDTVH